MVCSNLDDPVCPSGPERSGLNGSSILIVGAGFYQKPAVQAARQMGYVVVTVDRDPKAPGALLADLNLTCSAHDPELVLENWKQVKKKVPPVAAVLCGGARGCVVTTAHLANFEQVPGPDIASAEILADKARLRTKLKALGANSSPFALIHSVAELAAFFNGHPLVLKPTTTSGGQGIQAIEHVQQISAAWEHAAAFAGGQPLLVEPLIRGQEVNVVALAAKGQVTPVALLERQLNPKRAFGSVGMYALPAPLAAPQANRLRDFACRVFHELGLVAGPAMLEVVIDSDGTFQVIEAECNLPGSFIAQNLIPLATGQDFLQASIRSVAGLAFPTTWHPKGKTHLYFDDAPALFTPAQHSRSSSLALTGPRSATILQAAH